MASGPVITYEAYATMSARKIGINLAVAMLPFTCDGAMFVAEGPQAYGRCRSTYRMKNSSRRRDVDKVAICMEAGTAAHGARTSWTVLHVISR